MQILHEGSSAHNRLHSNVSERFQKKKHGRLRMVRKGRTLTAIDFLAGLCGIAPLLKADEREPLGPPRIPVLGQEDARDPAKALEYLP